MHSISGFLRDQEMSGARLSRRRRGDDGGNAARDDQTDRGASLGSGRGLWPAGAWRVGALAKEFVQ